LGGRSGGTEGVVLWNNLRFSHLNLLSKNLAIQVNTHLPVSPKPRRLSFDNLFSVVFFLLQLLLYPGLSNCQVPLRHKIEKFCEFIPYRNLSIVSFKLKKTSKEIEKY
jgi:hypothetical protein